MLARMAVMGIAALLLVGCSGTDGPSQPAGEGLDLFPSKTLTDWVTYAQQISVVRVVSEQRIDEPIDTSIETETDRHIGRSVHLVVERNLWVAPGFTPRQSVDLVVAGWRVKEGVEVKKSIAGGPRIEVGDVLVMPVSQDLDGKATPLSPHAIVPIEAKTVDRHHSPDPAVSALAGKSYDEMAALLAATPSDPLAAPFMDLNPLERYMKVDQARQAAAASQTPTS